MELKIGNVRINRRAALRTLVGVVGTGCALDLATSPARAAKMSQAAVSYQGSPKGAQDCSNCKLFEAPGSCKSVDGAISPQGWCKIYVKA